MSVVFSKKEFLVTLQGTLCMEQMEGEEKEFMQIDVTLSTKLDHKGKQRIGQEQEFSMNLGDT